MPKIDALPSALRAYFDEEPALGLAEPGGPFNAGCIVDGDTPSRRSMSAGSSNATAFALYEQGGYALTVRLVIVSIAGSSRGTLAVYDIPSGERSVTKVQALFAGSDRPMPYRCSRPHAGDAG